MKNFFDNAGILIMLIGAGADNLFTAFTIIIMSLICFGLSRLPYRKTKKKHHYKTI